jgi:ribosomal protein S12 methylthiotransferase accessory factor YcaO
MKIWYQKITPPMINIETVNDLEVLRLIKMLRDNGVELSIFNTTSLNDFNIPSIMILCKNNAG